MELRQQYVCFRVSVSNILVSEENRRREALKSRQIAERLGVEEAHMLEFQQFTALYAFFN